MFVNFAGACLVHVLLCNVAVLNRIATLLWLEIFTPRVMSSQHGGGCQVQWRVPSTVEGYLAVQWGAIMKYSGGCGVRWRAI